MAIWFKHSKCLNSIKSESTQIASNRFEGRNTSFKALYENTAKIIMILPIGPQLHDMSFTIKNTNHDNILGKNII